MCSRLKGYKITKEANYTEIKVYMFSISTLTGPRNSIHKLPRDTRLRVWSTDQARSAMEKRVPVAKTVWNVGIPCIFSGDTCHRLQLSTHLTTPGREPREMVSQGTLWRCHARLADSWGRLLWFPNLCVPNVWSRWRLDRHLLFAKEIKYLSSLLSKKNNNKTNFNYLPFNSYFQVIYLKYFIALRIYTII